MQIPTSDFTVLLDRVRRLRALVPPDSPEMGVVLALLMHLDQVARLNGDYSGKDFKAGHRTAVQQGGG